jgi:hypothetical protein
MLHSYGQFTDDTRDYIISQALELVFKRAKEFIRWVEQQRNANNNAEGMVRRTGFAGLAPQPQDHVGHRSSSSTLVYLRADATQKAQITIAGISFGGAK